ncbi:MAG TPA: glycoside hydrolase family 15 protein [Pseudolabrys sp.]|jgi:glucoamylase|nr:glycoside hydrolase family 15 protein [Pseudolabrys sp.]
MAPLNYAPGWPGIDPTWTSSAKDVATRALGTSRLWVTIGHGILNEVYWPSTGMPQIRDLGFIVATRSGWYEVKRVCRYTVALPEPFIPCPTITHEGDDYKLILDFVPDPSRDAVLISFRLTGEAARLYALLAPHLGNSGRENNAAAGVDLTAWRGAHALCLCADSGFARTGAGFVGGSDGWQDFAHNGEMKWTYGRAENGNVALMGELNRNEGVLALGFAHTVEGARTLAQSSLNEGFARIHNAFTSGWSAWARGLKVPDAPPELRREALLSAAVLRTHEDATFPGAMVASLSIPWGNASDSSGGYHLVWTRDAVESGLALMAIGQTADAHRLLSYLVATQREDGSWYQNYFPDGRPYWFGHQIDEVSFPVLLAAKLAEEGLPLGAGVTHMIRRAAAFLVRNGPGSQQDRWEENAGISPFSLGVQIVALIAAAPFLADAERAYALEIADYWNERIEDWTYATGGALAQRFGVDGYYVRIGPSLEHGGLKGRIEVKNRNGETLPAVNLVGMEFLWLVRLGLREASDPRIRNTLVVTDALLKVETPSGVAFHRYNQDGYGEHADGSPFDGSGVGRAWPLLAGERGHYALQSGADPLPYLQAMAHMTGPGGLIPEQVWDSDPIPARGLYPGKPSGSAMPLVWAHSEFLKLLVACEHKRPVELLASTERYLKCRPASGTWHWRFDTPFDALPKERDLAFEGDAPFMLHLGFDGWHDAIDRTATINAFGLYEVRLPWAALKGREAVDFTFYFPQRAAWEGSDHRVVLSR